MRTWGLSVFTHGPSLHPGLGRCPWGRGARRQAPARDCRVPSDVLSWGAAHNTVGISAQQSALWPSSREVHFFLPKSLGMFVAFRNVISARFLRSSVPDRQEPAADEAAVSASPALLQGRGA